MSDPDARLIELESRLAYQDDALNQLSDQLHRQQQDIEGLQLSLARLASQLTALRDQAEQPAGENDAPPPHY